MSKINPTVKTERFANERLAGGFGAVAAKENNVAALRRVVMANLLWEDIAYVDGKTVANEIARLIPLCKPAEVAQIALEARKDQKLRHTPLFIISEMCKYPEHRALVGDLMPKVITRADMLTDFLAIYWKEGKRPLCAQAKKGLAKSFKNFDEYQFAKYDRDAAIKIRDIMFLCHPKPSNKEEEALYKRIAERNLATPDTWEVALSTGKDKKETWTRLIETGKLGGLAMLRNINNMKSASVDKNVIRKGLETLKSSWLLPLDFLKARQMNPEFERDIEDAMLKSYERLPKLPGRTLFIVDVSGSMCRGMAGKSQFDRLDCAKAMAMLAASQCEDYELVCTAGSDSLCQHKSAVVKYPRKGFGIFEDIDKEYRSLGGGGIFTRQVLEWARGQFKDKEFDRIIVFSDSQDCDWADKRTPKPFGKHNYICDVSAHTKGVNYKGCWDAEVSGFSDHFISFIAGYEGVENQFEMN